MTRWGCRAEARSVHRRPARCTPSGAPAPRSSACGPSTPSGSPCRRYCEKDATEKRSYSAMTNSDSPPRSRGRPRAFDEAQVLDAALGLFWRVGYRDASVPDISAVTGLSTSSLYNVYGSKLGLFEAALGRYLDEVIDGYMVGPLARGSAGLADVEAFLDRLEGTIDRNPARGC